MQCTRAQHHIQKVAKNPVIHACVLYLKRVTKGAACGCAQSGRSQDAKPFVQKAKRAILLSGTPASARPRELFPLVQSTFNAVLLTVKR